MLLGCHHHGRFKFLLAVFLCLPGKAMGTPRPPVMMLRVGKLSVGKERKILFIAAEDEEDVNYPQKI